jgi:hypothetical protein
MFRLALLRLALLIVVISICPCLRNVLQKRPRNGPSHNKWEEVYKIKMAILIL